METNNKNILKETGNRIPFTVPEGYFEGFALQMEARTSGSKSFYLKKVISPWMYMAAMFIGMLLIGNLLFNVYKTNKQDNAEMYEMYVMSQMDNSVMIDYYVDQTENVAE
jgi:hypothetical protein